MEHQLSDLQPQVRQNRQLPFGYSRFVVAGSNYPGGFVSSLSPTSTVEYYGTVAQTIYATPTDGNLTLTNNSLKTAGSPLTIASNVLINPNANFRANGATGWITYRWW